MALYHAGMSDSALGHAIRRAPTSPVLRHKRRIHRTARSACRAPCLNRGRSSAPETRLNRIDSHQDARHARSGRRAAAARVPAERRILRNTPRARGAPRGEVPDDAGPAVTLAMAIVPRRACVRGDAVVMEQRAVEQDQENLAAVRPCGTGDPFPVAPGGDHPSARPPGPTGRQAGEAPPEPDQRGGASHGAADPPCRPSRWPPPTSSPGRLRPPRPPAARRHQLRGREAQELPGLLGRQVPAGRRGARARRPRSEPRHA